MRGLGKAWQAGRCWLPLAAMAAASFGIAFLAGCSAGDDGTAADLPDPDDYAQALHEGANAERVQAGLDPLEWSECIVPIAQERADLLNETQDLEHAPLTATCNEGATAGENLSLAEVEPQEITDRWMASAGHEANILNAAFVTVAVACAREQLDSGPMACSWVAEGLSPDDPDYVEPEGGTITSN